MENSPSFTLLDQSAQFNVKTHSKIHCYITCTHLLVSPCCFLKLLKPLLELSTVNPPTFITIYTREEAIILIFGFHVDWTCCLWNTPIRGEIFTCRWTCCHHGCIFAIISRGYLSNNKDSGGSLWINTYFLPHKQKIF